jgi:dUTP pyrophosphatase
VDSDYRGEIAVILVNLGREPFAVTRGDRIAQLVVAPVSRAVWRPVEDLEETVRGAGGFGSSGVK